VWPLVGRNERKAARVSTKVWLLRYTRGGADGPSYSLHPVPFETRDDAEYEGCCHWGAPAGRGVEALHIQAVPVGGEPDENAWEPVAAASTCGGVRLTAAAVVS
jgi:hypothetical protein